MLLIVGVLLFIAISCSMWFFVISELRSYTIDLTRQRLFEVRDRLFDAAEQGEISYSARAYGMSRTTINGMIQFCHELTFMRILAIAFAAKTTGVPGHIRVYREELEEALAELPAEQQRLISGIIHRMNFIVVMHLLRTSMLLFYMIVGFVAARAVKRVFRRTIKRATQTLTVQIIEGEANLLGAAA